MFEISKAVYIYTYTISSSKCLTLDFLAHIYISVFSAPDVISIPQAQEWQPQAHLTSNFETSPSLCQEIAKSQGKHNLLSQEILLSWHDNLRLWLTSELPWTWHNYFSQPFWMTSSAQQNVSWSSTVQRMFEEYIWNFVVSSVVADVIEPWGFKASGLCFNIG